MSKIFSAEQIKKWDKFTIQNEPISSLNLMERASKGCVQWICDQWPDKSKHFAIFCGNGNNGGDGLAIARLLLSEAYHVDVYITHKRERSEENTINLKALESIFSSCIHYFQDDLIIANECIVIDAIVGIGLNTELREEEKKMVACIEKTNCVVLSIDIPSGLHTDKPSEGQTIIKANYTLSFQQYKMAFLFPESGQYTGLVVLIDIHLSEAFRSAEPSSLTCIDKSLVKSYYKKRNAFAHKGNYGHALLYVGEIGKMGAAILSTKACLRAGAGLVSILAPMDERSILQIAAPEAMLVMRQSAGHALKLEVFNAIALGCGLGQDQETIEMVKRFCTTSPIPLILDADAINILAGLPQLLNEVPKNSLITPHVKEFERLFGASKNSFERFELQKEMSIKHKIYILLKGKHSSITTPEGQAFFNTTGNPGMATGGSGDTLTGIICGLYAQYENMLTATLLGVYLHGKAGDIAAKQTTEESMIASDLIEHLGAAFKECFYT